MPHPPSAAHTTLLDEWPKPSKAKMFRAFKMRRYWLVKKCPTMLLVIRCTTQSVWVGYFVKSSDLTSRIPTLQKLLAQLLVRSNLPGATVPFPP